MQFSFSLLTSQRRRRGAWLFLFGCLLFGSVYSMAASENISPATASLYLRKPIIQIPKEYSDFLIQDRIWEGEVKLNGNKYLVGALVRISVGNKRTSSGVYRFLLQPLEKNNLSVLPWILPPDSNPFFDGHLYRMHWSFEKNDSNPVLLLNFQLVESKLMEYMVSGNDIVQLHLSGISTNNTVSNVTVLVNNPGPVIQIPAGDYSEAIITVGNNKSPVRFRSHISKIIPISNIVKAGSPLTNRLTCKMEGRSLFFESRLMDKQGNWYVPVDNIVPPNYLITQNGKTIHLGVFTSVFRKRPCTWTAPFYLDGEFKIQAFQKLGGLGSDESEPFVFQIKWTYPILEAAPWILLIAVVAYERRNRRNNRWILIATAVGFCIVWVLEKIFNFMPMSHANILRPVFQSLLYGYCMSCLLSSYVHNSKQIAAILKKSLFLVAASALALLSLMNIHDDGFDRSLLILILLGPGLMLSWITATALCRSVSRLITLNFVFASIFFVLIIGFIACIIQALDNSLTFSQVVLHTVALVIAATIIFQPLFLTLWFHPSQRRRLSEMTQ